MSYALYEDGFSLYFIDNGPIYTHPSYSLADLAHFLNPLKNCSSREAGPRLQGSCNNSISLRYLCEQGIDCIFQIQVTPLTISKLLTSEHIF